MTPESDSNARYRRALQNEVDSAALYHALAEAEDEPRLSEVYRRLAATEEAHVAFWTEKLRAAGSAVPEMRAGWRPRVLGWLARRLGAGVVLPAVRALEIKDTRAYADLPAARTAALPAHERSHARVLRAIAAAPGPGVEGSVLARLEGRHRGVGGNALRAAVLGANDGLLSNFSLVMGVAGAELTGNGILITGVAGLLAGAGSMALGEWLSVQSSRELYQRQIGIEAEELAEAPEEEAQELALIYQAKGLPEDEARAVARRLTAERDRALDTLAREELGIDPSELGGSAWGAAATSFILFALGAIVPVAPYVFLARADAILVSAAVSAVGLFLIGAATSLLTGRGVVFTGLRQLGIGVAAAALTFGIGRLLGVALAG